MHNELMCHVVAGYPSQEECVELLLGMQKAGVSTIEVQIPFSDPIADGETIMIVNDKALESGMTTKKSFDLINKARKSGLKTDIYIMSYVQKLISFGIEDFCAQAKSAGVKGLIIPDLPIEAEEYEMLRKSSEKNGLEIVPVVSPTSNKARLKSNLKSAKDLVYLTSIKGITGNKLKLGELLKKTARDIKKQSPDTKLAIGFGIDSKKDVEEIMRIADMAVIGSSVIRRINKGGVKESLKFVRSLI